MTTCKGCGRDMDRQSTHWEGCHEHHPECASCREGFKAGREQGMREAAAICKGKADWIIGRQEGPQEELSNVIVRHHASAHLAAHDAILAAIGEGK